MIALTRAGWLASALFFGALVASIAHVDFVGPMALVLLGGVALLSFVRPAWALPLVTGLLPIAWFGATRYPMIWNAQVAWPEALACAALAGLGLDACRGRTAVPRALAAPAAVFGALVLAALAPWLRVDSLRSGSAFWGDLARTMMTSYFVDHHLTAVHAGLLLLEGTLFYVHAARLCAAPGMLRRVAAATAIGSAAAALCTFDRLAEAAARGQTFWPSLLDLAARLRWNVHYTDMNAAGSFYALAVLAGVALAATASGLRRLAWMACIACGALALWLTGSRIAVLAALAAAAGALLLPRAIRGRRQAIAAGVLAVTACAGLVLLAVVLPERGIQKSPWLAADVRVGLLHTGVRMLRVDPAFGIGLGEFQQRSGEFSSPDLLAKFPAVIRGENAHNNVLQVTAELGLTGGLAFVWMIGAGFIAVAWRASQTRDRFLQLVLAALGAFALTALAGHPLLIPEASYAFWLVAGAAAGTAIGERPDGPRPRRMTVLAATALAVVALTLPLRLRAAAREADLEHVGIGVTGWRLSPDGIRYREGVGHASQFVPSGGFKFSVNSRSAAAVRLEISVDGRVADVVMLAPNQWVDIVVPGRTVRSDARFQRMDLRTLDDDSTVLWVSKDEPIPGR